MMKWWEETKPLLLVIIAMVVFFGMLFGLTETTVLDTQLREAQLIVIKPVLRWLAVAVFVLASAWQNAILWFRRQKSAVLLKDLNAWIAREDQYWTANTALTLSASASRFVGSNDYALDLKVTNRSRAKFIISGVSAEALDKTGWNDAELKLCRPSVEIEQSPVNIVQTRRALEGLGGTAHVYLRNVKLTVRREDGHEATFDWPDVLVKVPSEPLMAAQADGAA